MRNRHVLMIAALLAGCSTSSAMRHATAAVPPPSSAAAVRNGSAGLDFPSVAMQQLHAAYWIARAPHADQLRLDAKGVAALNEAQYREDPTFNRMSALPLRYAGTDVGVMIQALSKRPSALLLQDSVAVAEREVDGWMAALALDAIPAQVTPRWALVTRRADLRTFPTDRHVYRNAAGISERIDRFQESALFPNTPVAVVQTSLDGQWGFVISPTYKAWLRLDHLAFAPRDTVLATVARADWRVIAPKINLDQRQWDMSATLESRDGAQALLPQRLPDGSLGSVRVSIPAGTTVVGALPYTERNLLEQAFKLLGEPYGWGHSDGTRDCSGFVSEVYRSMGVQLARNTGAQRDSPVLRTRHFAENAPRTDKLAVLASTQPGDLVFIPGHVMMVVGHVDGVTYIIHDTPGTRVINAAGQLKSYPLDGISLTPFQPLRSGADKDFVDVMRAVQHVVAR